MRHTTLLNHLGQDEIRERMITSKDREQYQRWQCIFLTSKGLQPCLIAEYVGSTKGTIHQWVYHTITMGRMDLRSMVGEEDDLGT